MTNDFKKQYEHPLWQKKRLEALENSEWQCDSCMKSDKQLQVHHKYYKKGNMVWDYDLDELSVLCDKCHKKKHEEWEEIDELIRCIKRNNVDISCLKGYLEATIFDGIDSHHNFNYKTTYYEGVAQYFGLPSNLVAMRGMECIDDLQDARRNLNKVFGN